MKNKFRKTLAISLAMSIIFSTAVIPSTFAAENINQQQELILGNDHICMAKRKNFADRSLIEQWKSKYYGDWLAHQGTCGFLLASARNTVESFVHGIKSIRNLFGFARYEAPYWIRSARDYFKKDNKNINPKLTSENVIERLDKEFKKVKGQEKAKQQLKDAIISILDKREQSEFGIKVDKGATLIMLKGASGTGKSMLLKCLENVLMGEGNEAYCIDSSSVDSSDPKSIIGQLFDPIESSYGGRWWKSGESNPKQKTSLVKHLEENPSTLLKIEEYDKWGNKQTDEMFRTMHDSGEIHTRNQKIDVSSLIVVMTSNEGSQDSTGSRTSVIRDKSFMNRFTVIEFDNLCEEDYKEIAETQLNDLKEFYNERNNVNINYVNVAENIAKHALESNVGARIIEKEIINSLRAKLIGKVMTDESESSDDKNAKPEKKNVYIAYDHINKEFAICDTEEEAKKFSEEVDNKAKELKELKEKEKQNQELEKEEKKEKEEENQELEKETKEEPEKLLSYSDFLNDLSGF